MQHIRRLASIPVIAAVGVLALAGCRSEPGVAAYVGDTRITEERVTAIVDDAARALREVAPDTAPPARSVVVSTLVLGEVCERLDAQPQPGQSPITPEQAAQEFMVPPDTEFAREIAKLYTCLQAVPVGAPVAPTPEQLAEVLKRARAAGAIPDGMSDENAAGQFDSHPLRTALAQRKALSEAVARHNVTVNPRYRPLEFPVLRFRDASVAVGVPLGEPGSDAVIDRR